MNNKQKQKLVIQIAELIIIGILISLGSGCASFQGNKLSPVTSFPEVSTKRSLQVGLDFSATLNGDPVSLGVETAEKQITKKCIKRLRKSGLFSQVSENNADPDLMLHVEIKDKGEASIEMAVVTGLTLYIIPSSATDTYQLTATLTDTNGNSKNIQLEDSVTQWQQIFLLPLLPFKSTIAEASKCQNKLFDNLAVEIEKTGMLEN